MCRSLPWIGLVLAALAAPVTADVLVICHDDFRPALAPWVELRRDQGHAISFLSNEGPPAELQAAIRERAATGPLRFVVLVGDGGAAPDAPAAARRLVLSTDHIAAHANRSLGGGPDIATDNTFADLDGDQVPDLAVGRLTADTPADLARMVEKIVAHERADHGPWRRRVHFVAGLGGFGELVDAALESWTKTLITDGVPPAYATTMTYGSWRSPYCPDPRRFRATALHRLNEGALFWVYIGHGRPYELDEVRVPGEVFPILAASDADQLCCQAGAPIALFLACYAGAIDARDDCLAEELLRAPGGPVAVVAGSRVTMPYAMAVLGGEMLKACFHEPQPTAGELLLEAKRQMVLRDRSDERSRTLDLAAEAFSPPPVDLEGQRREHLALFNLVGDPLLRIPRPAPLQVAAPATAEAGRPLSIQGTTSLAGTCTVELVVRRDRLTFKPPRREEYLGTPESLDEYQRIYDQANDHRLAVAEIAVTPGDFHVELQVPPDARGACHVRAFIVGAESCALGSADLKIVRSPQPR
jgi:hypothetical protein